MSDMTLGEYQSRVIAELLDRGFAAEGWDSGGGCVGVRVDFVTSELFSMLDEGAWTTWDWNDSDGNFLASLEVQARPFNAACVISGEVHTFPYASPTEMVEECVRVFDHILGDGKP